mgnify:CR=1 FL=1
MLEFVGRERRWVDKNKTGRVLQNVFRRDWLIGSVFGFEDDAAILEADRSVEHSFGHLDRRAVSVGAKNKFSRLMSLIIVEFLSDSATADDYCLGSFRMPVDRNNCVRHQDIDHPLGRIFGRSPQIIIHPATR